MADGLIVNGITTGGTDHYVLNDPAYSTANGTQQQIWNQGGVTDNAHWWAPPAHYGNSGHGSTLTNRPDSGGGGNNWANDDIGRLSMVIYMGDTTAGHTYQGSVVDAPGSGFTALAGELTPNQGCTGCNGKKLGDSLGGRMTGATGYSFTTDQFVSSGPGASYTGSNPTSTSTWPKLFFSPATTLAPTGLNGTSAANGYIDSSGSVPWGWSYTSDPDNCQKVESWVDATWTSSGQSATAGNITAPAPGSTC
jgi:hypothetical protein